MSNNSHARGDDPNTSKQAGQWIPNEVRAGSHAHRALQAYKEAGADGLTADEVDLETKVEGIWKRCSDLKRMGYIAPVMNGSEPRCRKSRYNFDNEVFAITEKGEARLEELAHETPARRRKRSVSRERRIFNLVEEWMEPGVSAKGFGTNLTRAEQHPQQFAREMKREWDK